MRRPVRLLLVASVLAAGVTVASPAPHAASSPVPPPGWSGRPTLVSGTARYDRGEWIYTDYVYDDYGADTIPGGQPNVVSLAPTDGDFRYPQGEAFAGNAADIVEVRAQLVGDDLEVRTLLQTIVDPKAIALWVQVDDDEPTVVTHKTAQIDSEANTVSFVLRNAARGRTVSLNIGAGLHDGSGGLRAGVPGTHDLAPDEITTGGPSDNRLFDLAFNTEQLEPRGGAWNESTQSDALASGDLERFAQEIEIAELRDRSRRPVEALEPGYHVQLFRSRQDLGEGVGDSFPQYRGAWQPYAIWIPETYDPGARTPLLLNLHSLSVHHNQYRGGESPTYTTFYEQMGNRLGAIVVTPLGRGPDGWYLDEAFVDTLEVWVDVSRHHRIDAARTRVTGYSMGGYGTYRFTTLMPDSFASAASIVGPPVDGIWPYPIPVDGPTFTYDQLENTRHIPFWITHGALDELVPVLGVREQAARFGALGHEYRFALHPGEDHLSFAVKDEWSREAGWLEEHERRVRNPQRITLDVRPASLLSESSEHLRPLVQRYLRRLGARVDGAYWVDDVVPTGSGDVTASIDLTSGGISMHDVGTVPVNQPGTDGPSPYALTGADVVSVPDPTIDVLHGTLSGTRALTVDLGRAGLTSSPRIEVSTDAPARLSLVRGDRLIRTVRLQPTTSA